MWSFQNLAPNGYPDMTRIGALLPLHGNGQISHTSQSGDNYRFGIVWNADIGSYDVFIVRDPNYRGRDSSLHASHRLKRTSDQYHRICFQAGKEPKDLRMAVAMSLVWAERTSSYIADGDSWS